MELFSVLNVAFGGLIDSLSFYYLGFNETIYHLFYNPDSVTLCVVSIHLNSKYDNSFRKQYFQGEIKDYFFATFI